ncbi:putative transposase [Acinetobacter sp. 983759]|nr:putative transposase [Acinetobacter sp. 983759]
MPVQAVHGVIYLLILVNGIPSLKDVNGILKLLPLISY